MSARTQNEKQFPNWEDLPGGGRRYWLDRGGRTQGRARYIKVVDANEQTVSFTQEIYDGDDRLIARHQKYPADTGHQRVAGSSQEDDE